MRVISLKKLRQFWELHPDAEDWLRAWYRTTKQERWTNFAEVRALFNSADQVGKFTVFNVRGNRYRLIVHIHFNTSRVYVRHVLTHRDYDRGKWKGD